MNPEDTDRYKRFEDVMYRLADLPKKVDEDLEKTESSKTESSDETVDKSPEDPKA